MHRKDIYQDGFHPLVMDWFTRQVGAPTAIQSKAWPSIAQGEHVLAVAPTGSGKTLAAFLHGLDRLLTGQWPTGRTSMLYVSPMKALNNDVARNLTGPLKALTGLFKEQGLQVPDIRVGVRSGDTPESERRRMVRRPPEILVTTPESLNLLITSASGRSILGNVSCVILDEIHAVAGSKRGVFLMTAVERLAHLAGEFQRIAISATVRPLDTVAELVGGYALSGPATAQAHTKRPVRTIVDQQAKRLELSIRSPRPDKELSKEPERDAVWKALARESRDIIDQERTSLLFVNSRAMSEKMAMLVNRGGKGRLAYSHHGSLSKEIRREVEEKLKSGGLRAVVATNSLELGIDVGDLDRVVLVQTPPSVSSTLQRMGRAGHRVGETSRAVLLTSHSEDILNAAVMAGAVRERDLEPLSLFKAPLDVLAQVLVSMAVASGGRGLDVDEAFAMVCMCASYQDLGRDLFESVLHMLAGRYAETRIRELKPRLSWDRVENRIYAAKGAAMALYASGGVIPDRGYYGLRLSSSNQRIGELDEEFVWEARIGQVLTLGVQNWRIERITQSDVLVVPAEPSAWAAPFWRAEDRGRDSHFANRKGLFLEQAEEQAGKRENLESWLERDQGLDRESAAHLARFLDMQRSMTRCSLPHAHHLLVEYTESGPGASPGYQIIIHAPLGLGVNMPWSLALAAVWDEQVGEGLMHFASNDCIALVLPQELEAEKLLSMVRAENVNSLLARSLVGSAMFGAHFREACGRALLLERRRFGERRPLWLSRLKAAKLMDAVTPFGDFPMMVEAWNNCLSSSFDLGRLKEVLAGLATGEIGWSEARTSSPSPMARNLSWKQVNTYMYRTDEVPGRSGPGLWDEVLEKAVFTPELRPSLDPELVAEFEARRRRTAEGYAPLDVPDLLDLVKDRLLIEAQEWRDLLTAIRADHEGDLDAWLRDAGNRLVWVKGPGGNAMAGALEMVDRFACLYAHRPGWRVEGFDGQAMEWPVPDTAEESLAQVQGVMSQWLSHYGPMGLKRMVALLGLELIDLAPLLESLVADRLVLGDVQVEGWAEQCYCDAGNLEMLLRMGRRKAKPMLEPLGTDCLPLVTAVEQGLLDHGDGMEALSQHVVRLLYLPADASAWEEDILPARSKRYDPAWMDALPGAMDLVLLGAGERKLSLCPARELDLLEREERAETDVEALFTDRAARYDLTTLSLKSGLEHGELGRRLWEGFFQGRVSTDSFAALRQGVVHGFSIPDKPILPVKGSMAGRRRGARMRARTRQSSLPWPGNWYVPDFQVSSDEGLVELEERRRERARILLDRYGVLFREILGREQGVFAWREIFPALRLMELAGEVVGGQMFTGASAPQFMTLAGLRRLARTVDRRDVYWFNATDPASLCGLGISGLKGVLPERRPGTHLVFRGRDLVLVSRGHGKVLDIRVEQDDPDLPLMLEPLRHMLTRRINPRRRLKVESINEEAALASPYLDTLRSCFKALPDHSKVTLFPLVP